MGEIATLAPTLNMNNHVFCSTENICVFAALNCSRLHCTCALTLTLKAPYPLTPTWEHTYVGIGVI